MRTTQVTVLPYDPAWKADFEAIRQELASALGGLAIAIEHVGSTSVEGLSAKPCIDIDVVMPDRAVFPQIVERLAAIGYTHEGDLGIPDREAFCYTGKPHLRLHHLYVCSADSEELHRHLVFRDFLRTHPEAVERYSACKEDAARRFPEDIEGYMACKGPCIEALYKRCGLSE